MRGVVFSDLHMFRFVWKLQFLMVCGLRDSLLDIRSNQSQTSDPLDIQSIICAYKFAWYTVYIYIHMHCIHIYIYIYIYITMYIYIHIFMCVWGCVCVYVSSIAYCILSFISPNLPGPARAIGPASTRGAWLPNGGSLAPNGLNDPNGPTWPNSWDQWMMVDRKS